MSMSVKKNVKAVRGGVFKELAVRQKLDPVSVLDVNDLSLDVEIDRGSFL